MEEEFEAGLGEREDDVFDPFMDDFEEDEDLFWFLFLNFLIFVWVINIYWKIYIQKYIFKYIFC